MSDTTVEGFWEWISQFKPLGTKVYVKKVQLQMDSDILWTPTPEYDIYSSKDWGKNPDARSYGFIVTVGKKVKSVEVGQIVVFDWECVLPLNIGSMTKDMYWIEEKDIDMIIGYAPQPQKPTGNYNH
jgi:hypothetical protein